MDASTHPGIPLGEQGDESSAHVQPVYRLRPSFTRTAMKPPVRRLPMIPHPHVTAFASALLLCSDAPLRAQDLAARDSVTQLTSASTSSSSRRSSTESVPSRCFPIQYDSRE